MRDVWDRLAAWEIANLPPDHIPTRPRPATRAAVTRARGRFPGLPDDVLASASVHDGGSSPVFAPWTLDPLDLLGDDTWRREVGGRGIRTEGPVRKAYFHAGWVTFAHDGGGNHLCLDLQPKKGGHLGQIVHFVHDDVVRRVVAPSFRAWLIGIVEALERGERVWSSEYEAVRDATAPTPADPDLRALAEALFAAIQRADHHTAFALPGLGSLTVHLRRPFIGEHMGRTLTVQGQRLLVFRGGPELAERLTLASPVPVEGDVAWIAAAGRTEREARAAFETLVASTSPSTTAFAWPGLGEFTVKVAERRGRLVSFQPTRARRDALRIEPTGRSPT